MTSTTVSSVWVPEPETADDRLMVASLQSRDENGIVEKDPGCTTYGMRGRLVASPKSSSKILLDEKCSTLLGMQFATLTVCSARCRWEVTACNLTGVARLLGSR